MTEVAGTTSDRGRTARLLAAVFGVVFLLVGVAGFIPGVTTNYDELEFAGHNSGALLLGIFAVSVLHNIVHLLYGVWGLVSSRRDLDAVRVFFIGGGVVYLLLWLYGLVVHNNGDNSNFVPVNGADNWLHLVLGLALVASGLLFARRVTNRAAV